MTTDIHTEIINDLSKADKTAFYKILNVDTQKRYSTEEIKDILLNVVILKLRKANGEILDLFLTNLANKYYDEKDCLKICECLSEDIVKKLDSKTIDILLEYFKNFKHVNIKNRIKELKKQKNSIVVPNRMENILKKNIKQSEISSNFSQNISGKNGTEKGVAEKLKKQIKNKDKELSEKNVKLQGKEEEIARLKRIVETKDNFIFQLNATISNLEKEKEKLIKEKRVEHDNLSATINELNDKIQNKNTTIESLKIQINDEKIAFINKLTDLLQIRYRDYIKYKDKEDLSNEKKAEFFDIILEKIFETLTDNGFSF